uniref:Aspartate/glutamate leucyltransferase n=1 Tax=uncultured Thiotrichaceae bacterium TaxID=298394 RepID=A0A6S6T9H5_9GAMM|nr:MAG: Arginine-tRNA-protein transferase (EC [uncultured Thiotrichaceae bacterium]
MLSDSLELYITAAHDCPYLSDRKATNLLVDPGYDMNLATYSRLIDKGFRRSGSDVYRPCCYRCQSCVSTRIPVKDFRFKRSQKRNWNNNSDLAVRVNTAGYKPEYSDLYLRYIRSRHAGGGMDDDSPASFANFILTSWCETALLEFWQGDVLLAVAATDKVKQGLSSVYTFFDPDEGAARGLGTYALLWQIHWAREQKLPYVYPGYWIAESPKMNYKTRFSPIKGFIDDQWVDLPEFKIQGS